MEVEFLRENEMIRWQPDIPDGVLDSLEVAQSAVVYFGFEDSLLIFEDPAAVADFDDVW